MEGPLLWVVQLASIAKRRWTGDLLSSVGPIVPKSPRCGTSVKSTANRPMAKAARDLRVSGTSQPRPCPQAVPSAALQGAERPPSVSLKTSITTSQAPDLHAHTKLPVPEQLINV